MTLDPGAGASQAPALQDKAHYPIGPFEPELGGSLVEVILAYETWGTLNEAADNAVEKTLAHATDKTVDAATSQAAAAEMTNSQPPARSTGRLPA